MFAFDYNTSRDYKHLGEGNIFFITPPLPRIQGRIRMCMYMVMSSCSYQGNKGKWYIMKKIKTGVFFLVVFIKSVIDLLLLATVFFQEG